MTTHANSVPKIATRTLGFAAVGASMLALAACGDRHEAQPQSVEGTTNPDYSYSVLFKRNGCEVGRFVDDGRYIYTVMCPSTGVAKTQYETSCGKSCHRPVQSLTATEQQEQQAYIKSLAPQSMPVGVN